VIIQTQTITKHIFFRNDILIFEKNKEKKWKRDKHRSSGERISEEQEEMEGGNNVAVAVDPTLRVVKGAGQKRPRVDEAQQKAGTAAGGGEPAVSQQGGGKRQKTSGGGGGKKKGGKKGSKNNKKKDNAAKQDKLKVGGGLELLDAELLGPEEQATFVQAQYRAADPTLAISAGQSLPSGTPPRPFFFIF
jgi:hypothetical protein